MINIPQTILAGLLLWSSGAFTTFYWSLKDEGEKKPPPAFRYIFPAVALMQAIAGFYILLLP